jgi:thiamine biosynthesis lipoprotein
MQKMSTKIALNGQTMGTRWSAICYATENVEHIQVALQAAVSKVDQQMSTWKPDSDLMRLNAAALNQWHSIPDDLAKVIELGLAIGEASDGAFDIGLGHAVRAWGFAANPADPAQIKAAIQHPRPMTQDALELDRANLRIRKKSVVDLDLSGIAKGFAVDQMIAVLLGFGITSALCSLDGELRAIGNHPDGKPWSAAVERHDYQSRAAHSVLTLTDMAAATSGDYRHWVDVGAKRLSHTIDRQRGAPVDGGPASVTVLANTCIAADAWATALLVKGVEEGAALARQQGLSALFLTRAGAGFDAFGVGAFA